MGRASITVDFNRDTDMDFARLDLSERLATLQEELPAGVESITVLPYVPPEFEAQSEQQFLQYTLTGPHTVESLREHLEEIVVPELTQIEGVALATAFGGRDRLIEVELDRDKISALGLSPYTIGQRVRDLDLVREAGAVREGSMEWVVTIRNRPGSVNDIRDAIVTVQDNRLVRVSDVAVVRDTYEDAYQFYRVDGRPAVQLRVVKKVRANTVRVADAVKARMANLERLSPDNAWFILDNDESEEIRRQLTDLRSRALVSAVVIFLVLLLFLRSFTSAGLVFATIAFSILISLNLIYFGGFSLNLLTLMGLAMGFGLIVDNSIVVLENVYRRWQGGEAAATAAELGSKQVVLPILASTLTTLIVFVPFVYLKGELRVFYIPLAVVVALTLFASLFVAFTFIPALAARLLQRDGPGKEEGVLEEVEVAPLHARPLYVRFYASLVGWTLRNSWAAVTIAVLAVGGSYYLFNKYVTRGVVWGTGWGQETFIAINLRLPRGSDLERTDQLARFFEERLERMPEIERFVTNVGGTYGFIRVTFPDSLEFTNVPVAIKDQLFAYSLGFSGAEVRVFGYGPSFYGGGGGAPNYSITVLGYNYERVESIAENLGTRLRRLSRVREVDTNASAGWFQRDKASEFVVDIDRSALSRYDLSVTDLVRQIGAAVQGQVALDQIKVAGEEIRYDVKLEGNREVDLVELRETIVSAPDGTGLRLGDVVAITSKELLARIRRENQQYERRVAYEFRGPRKLGDLVHDAVIEATGVPPGYTVKKEDSWRWSDEQRLQVYMVLAVSILLIYMVTAALFESLRQPLCVLFTVPMALIGVFLMFFYTDASFTREAYIGVIMMGGIVVNNSILLVDHINRIRAELGRSLREAILEGTLQRVRPILMTTATTVLGLLPLVLFSEAADSNIWNALAYALIGGLLSSTFLVLTVTPALYFLFERGVRRATVRVATPAPVGAD